MAAHVGLPEPPLEDGRMSAFLVAKETIHKAVFAMCRVPHGHGWKPAAEDMDKVGRELWRLNAQAVSARYSEPPEEIADEEYDYPLRVYPLPVALKALQCLIYQCSEGDIPKTSGLYQQMRDAELRLACEIVQAMPEYENAAWE